MAAKTFLEGTLKLSRRFGDSGSYVWGPLIGDEWDFFIDGLLKYQWTLRNTTAQEISASLFQESQGVHAVAVRLFTRCQIEAIRDGSEFVDAPKIRQVSKKSFALLQKSLNQLRIQGTFGKFEEEFVNGIRAIDRQESESAIPAKKKTRKLKASANVSERARAVSSLTSLFGDREEEITSLVDQILASRSDARAAEIVQSVVGALNKVPENSDEKRPTMSEICNKHLSGDNYEQVITVLREAGIISESELR